MRFFALIALSVVLSAGCAFERPSADVPAAPEQNQLTARINPEASPTVYTNGLWYTKIGESFEFVAGERYAENGVFVTRRPDEATVIDLGGAFVVPPFGEAHNHSVDGPGTEETAEKYLAEGVYYYKNPNSIYSFTEPMLDYWARPETLDVSFSYGGLSTDEGHPEKLYRMLLGFGMYSATDAEDLDGNAFYDVNTIKQLDEKWDRVLATRPDFVKLYLLEHDTDDSEGLSEPIFREAVRRADAVGLRTTVHPETLQDLALAVDAGATEAAHLPAYNLAIAKDPARSRIPDSLIDKMVAQGFIVVATTNVSRGREYSEEDLKTVTERQADNLRRMKLAGMPIAVGSDSYFQTAWNEIESLRALGVFTDAELLELWVQTPALSIFPGRAIGALEPGYEASFLGLACDPTLDIACALQAKYRIKNGLDLAERPRD